MPATPPGVVPRLRHHPRRQRVALDVAAATEEVRLDLHRRALEPRLPEVAHEAVAAVEVMHVGAQQPGAERRQPPWVRQLQEEVKVIAHETVVIKPQGETLAVAGEQPEKITAVLVVGEDGFAVMAAVHDMVAGGIGPLLAAGSAGHGSALGDGWLGTSLPCPGPV